MLQLAILRGARDYIALKSSCYGLAENKKILFRVGMPMFIQRSSHDKCIDELCKQMESLTLFTKESKGEIIAEEYNML